MGSALDLLDGVDGGQADDRGAMLDDRVDGAVDGGGIDEGPGRIVHQDHIVLPAAGIGYQLCQGVTHRLLAEIAAFDDTDFVAQAELGDLRPHTLNLRLAYGDEDGLDT